MLSKKDQTKSNRIKPKTKSKKSGIKDDTKPVRFNPTEYKARQDFTLEIGYCQVCGTSLNLDTPHHTEYGLGFKDDRFLICICQTCHTEIHSGSYANIYKTREQLKEIGWQNHLDFLSYKGGN